MSKLTNIKNLPAAIVKAVEADPYSKDGADLTVTGCLTPPQISYLMSQYAGEITEDVSDRIYALLGQSVHSILEAAGREVPHLIVEKRFFKVVSGLNVGGKIDLYDPTTKTLQDYKVCSVYKMKDGVPAEHEAQLNINAHLLRANGLPVDRVEIVAIYRDWSKSQAARSPGDYPERQVDVFAAPLWRDEVAGSYLLQRVEMHKAARAGLPGPCSAEDRWARPDVWAVMKKGRKTAIKRCSSESEAQAMCGNDSQLYVEYRPGESVRCKSFCPVSKYCQQGNALLKKERNDE